MSMRQTAEEFFFPLLWPLRTVYPKARSWKLHNQVLVAFSVLGVAFVVTFVFANATGLK